MSREEYLKQLADLLQDIPDQELEEALTFYRNYFDEAGQGEDVIAALGSPREAAAQLKNGLLGNGAETGEYTETGYHNSSRFEQKKVPVPLKAKPQKEKQQYEERQSYEQDDHCAYDENERNHSSRQRKQRSGTTIALIVILCVIGSPLLISAAAVIFSVFIGALGCIFAVAAASIAITFAAYAGGIALIVVGVANLLQVPVIGCLLFGGGLICLAIAILLTLALGHICGKFIPWAVRGIVHISGRIFRRGRKRDEKAY